MIRTLFVKQMKLTPYWTRSLNKATIVNRSSRLIQNTKGEKIEFDVKPEIKGNNDGQVNIGSTGERTKREAKIGFKSVSDAIKEFKSEEGSLENLNNYVVSLI